MIHQEELELVVSWLINGPKKVCTSLTSKNKEGLDRLEWVNVSIEFFDLLFRVDDGHINVITN